MDATVVADDVGASAVIETDVHRRVASAPPSIVTGLAAGGEN